MGLGPDFNWHLGRWGEGALQTYYARDLEPGTDLLDRDIDEERYRFHLAHMMSPRTNLHVKGVFRYQSDPLIVRDFFEGEYKDNIQPSTYLEVNQLWRNYSLDVLAQPRVNDFFETVERLPDIRLTGFRQQIGATPLFYESESSLAYLRRKFAEGDTNGMFSAMRSDTLHQVVLPQTFFGWLVVTPRVGARFTHYSEAEGEGATTEDENRGIFNTGAEASFKASQLWKGVSSKFWDVNGLRHIIRPSVNYAFVPNPTVRPRELPQFDYTIPSTRLLPIDFPDFNAIDEIDSQNVMRLGLQNKLQTKRKRVVENIVDWEMFADYRITRRTGQPSFSDLFSELDLRPFSWLTLSSEIRYGLSESALQETYHRLALTPNATWSAAIGHRFLRDDPQFGPDFGHNLIATTFYYRLNDNWGLRTSHHFEARDSTLEEQYYTVYRDFRSWTGALTFRVQDNREGPTDFTVAFTFNLKAFPRFDLRDDVIRPSKLVGR
jgi:LPS-assembly protein